MRFGIAELLIVFAVLLLFFGATRLPTLGSSLGSAIKNFKRGFSGPDEEDAAPTANPKNPDQLAGSHGVKVNEGQTSTKTSSKES